MMKRFLTGLIICAAAVLTMAGCNEKYTTYEGPSYVMFADTLSVYPVQESNESFDVTVAATRTSNSDRTFGIEIIPQGSNAKYDYHYRIKNQTVTIKAGEYSTNVEIEGIYDKIEIGDSLGFRLRLVSLDNVEWEMYGLETKVRLQKSCPFDINNFTGYCLVTSQFRSTYDSQYEPYLITSELVEGEENTVLLKGFYYEGYDIKIKFDPSDLLNPTVKMAGEQVIANTRGPFFYIYGDGLILADTYPGITSYFDTCENYAILYQLLRIEKEGYVGGFGNAIEWISDAEAKDYM